MLLSGGRCRARIQYRQICISIVVGLTYCQLAFSFIWKLHDDISPTKTITFSERYMFKTNNGPKLLANGDSFIETDVTVTMYMIKNISYNVAFAAFESESEHHHDTLSEMCFGQEYFIATHNKWASDVSHMK